MSLHSIFTTSQGLFGSNPLLRCSVRWLSYLLARTFAAARNDIARAAAIFLGPRFNGSVPRVAGQDSRRSLSAVLGFAKEHGLLHLNPAEGLRSPVPKTGRRRSKPYLTPKQLETIVAKISEPYELMVLVAIYTGLRPELAGLR